MTLTSVRRLPARLRCERGAFSLPELLVATGMLIVVFTAIVLLIPAAFTQSSASQERTFSVLQLRESVDRAIREMRTATSMDTPTTSKINYTTPSKSVVIECTNGQGNGTQGNGQGQYVCNRREAPLGQNPMDNVAFASNVTNTDVFCVASGPVAGRIYVGIKLVVAVPGSSGLITISNGTALRALEGTATSPACPN